tara:strand:- start:292 stop:477 length:186 start_codon:yes stop_codon:yes gene_type:complete
VDCRSGAIIEAVAILLGGITLMVTVHLLFAGYKKVKGLPYCEDITESIAEKEKDVEGPEEK